MNTGEKIRHFRMEKKLTQKQLGDLCGMADSAIRRYESGRGNPTEKTLNKIASALGIPVASLYGTEEILEKTVRFAEAVAKMHATLTFVANNPSVPNGIKNLAEDAIPTKETMISDIAPVFMAAQDKKLSRVPDDLMVLSDLWRSLNEDGKRRVRDYINDLLKIPEYQNVPETSQKSTEPHNNEKRSVAQPQPGQDGGEEDSEEKKRRQT